MGSEYSLGNGNSSGIADTASSVSGTHPRWRPVTLNSSGVCSGVRPDSVGMWCGRLATDENVSRTRQMANRRSFGDRNGSDISAVVQRRVVGEGKVVVTSDLNLTKKKVHRALVCYQTTKGPAPWISATIRFLKFVTLR